ncbi:BnaA03g46650D [Brassica napus]|uniref:BnaA03g46650D protein n=1 Tax=Brassica napus TaxID=3708 RepID=A0A078FCD6_BRANA|nr:BnaA03g46650D [Brassica napus]
MASSTAQIHLTSSREAPSSAPEPVLSLPRPPPS